MRSLKKTVLWLRSLVRSNRVESELDEELRYHIERQIEQNVKRGLSPKEARFAALREFGGVARIGEECREARGWRWLESFARDLRYGLRLLARSPGFALLGTLILALGIGGSTAVFSLLYTAVLRPLPYPEPERLVRVQNSVTSERGGTRNTGWSYPKFEDLRALTTSFELLAAFSPWPFSLTEGGDPDRILGEFVTSQYFEALHVAPLAGRLFAPEEERTPNAGSVALISEGLWRRRFNARSAAIGSTIHLNRLPFTVVGVLPAWFRGESGTAEIWVSVMSASLVQNNPTRLEQRMAHWLTAFGRLRPGLPPGRAHADVKSAVALMEKDKPPMRLNGEVATWGGSAIPLLEAKTDPAVSKSLLILLGAVSMVLLMACLNLANMLLGRAVARRQEVATRLAIGARRATLLRQFLTESVVLACLGGSAGLLLADRALDLLRALQPGGLRESQPALLRALETGEAGLGSTVLMFAAALTLMTVVLFGLWPALQACRFQPYDAIKGRASARGSFRLGMGGRAALVVSQVALAFVLLTGAGLMLRSFAALLHVPLGFEPSGLLTFRLELPSAHYDAPAARQFYGRLAERLRALPGVERVAVSNSLPLRGAVETTIGNVDNLVEIGDVAVHMVTPAFFEALHVPLLKGRLLDEDDHERTRHVALINESAAARFWPGGNPIGSRIALGLNGWWKEGGEAEIVGIVGDLRYRQLEEPVGVNVYVSSLQRAYPSNYVVLRSAGDPDSLAAAVRGVVKGLDAALPVYEFATAERIVADASSKTRFSGTLLGVFATLALLLAAAGVYAVISYSAAARTHEIGVRLALGAEPRSVVRLMMRDGALLCLAGLALGAVAALAATRLLAGFLYAVQPNDLATFVFCAALLLGLALLACYLPARRASRIDPLASLRYE